MLNTKVLLVVLVSTHSCTLDNINHAQPATTPVDTIENCQAQADILDAKTGVRAFCLEIE